MRPDRGISDPALRTPLPWYVLALVVILPFAASLPALHHGFVWDDKYFIVDNPYLRSLESVPSYFTTTRTQGSYDMHYYRPLRQAMFALEFRIFGLDPRGWHGINILLHCANVLLVLLLLRDLLQNDRAAFAAALFYSVHPVNSEVVASIAQRGDLLSAFFFLAAVLLARRQSPGALGVWRIACATGAYALALLSKETAIVLPAVIVLLDWIAPSGERPRFRERMPLYLALGAVAAVYVVVRASAVGGIGRGEYYDDSFLTTVISQMAVHVQYIIKFFVPYALSVRYDIEVVSSIANPYVIAFFIGAAALAAATVRDIRRGQLSRTVFGIWWFLILLLPVSNLVPIRGILMADRYLYLANIGLFVTCASVILQKIGTRRPVWVLAAGSAVLVLFTGIFMMRTSVWRDNLTLFEDARKHAPNSLVVQWNLHEEYARRNDIEKAQGAYLEMLRINEQAARNHLRVAERYLRQGKLADAERMAKRALTTKPDLEEAKKIVIEVNRLRSGAD